MVITLGMELAYREKILARAEQVFEDVIGPTASGDACCSDLVCEEVTRQLLDAADAWSTAFSAYVEAGAELGWEIDDGCCARGSPRSITVGGD